jgi:phosphotriesterase-related protein
MVDKSAEDIATEHITELTQRIGDTGIEPGIIGEVGCSWPLRANERKCLDAAAVASIETGIPISIHPGFHVNAPLQIVEIPTGAGVDSARIVLGHLDVALPHRATGMRLTLADTGCYLPFDLFGALATSSRALWKVLPPITIVWTRSRR